MTTAAHPRIAIASPGIGQVQRGFERLFSDLYGVVKGRLDVTLIKGGGARRDGEISPHFLRRNGVILRALPFHRLIGRTAFHVECFSFAMAIVPWLRQGRFDLLHVIDPPLARILLRLRRRLGFRTRLLYTEATNMVPGDYPPADHIHHVSGPKFQASLDQGIPSSHMSLIPAGIHPERFRVAESRGSLRQRHQIGANTFVVLCVAAINRDHKRIDHLVEEFAGLPGDCLLWLDGSMDHGEPDLPDWIRTKLGSRCRITRVPSDAVGELYRLADVLVLPSVQEAFALVLPEAVSAGLPVLAHDNPHFRWLLGSAANLVDMRARGPLRERLQRLRTDPSTLAPLLEARSHVARYDWGNLAAEYQMLYARILEAPLRDDLAFSPTPWRRGVRR